MCVGAIRDLPRTAASFASRRECIFQPLRGAAMTLASTIDFLVPDDLAELNQWVLWRYEPRHGKRTKVPYQVSGRPASSTDPRTWDCFEAVLNTWSNRLGVMPAWVSYSQRPIPSPALILIILWMTMATPSHGRTESSNASTTHTWRFRQAARA